MTVKELVDTLEEMMYTNPERVNYTVKMLGYNACGDRLYDIDVSGIMMNSPAETILLLD